MSVKKSLWLASAFSVVFPFSVFASELVVPAGTEIVIDADKAAKSIKHLSIGDKARITLADDVRFWNLELESLEVGEGAVIDASGQDGSAGKAGQDGIPGKEECESGKDAADGVSGVDGRAGKSILIKANKATIGSLVINAKGGRGGDGGIGGRGGDGNSGDGCKGGDAGNGGNGGHAGDGGHGGQVEIYFAADDMPQMNNISVDIAAGEPGAPGAAGEPGDQAEGHYLKRAVASGKKKWISGGEPGEKGKSGNTGVSGRQGLYLARVLGGASSSSGQVSAPEASPAGLDMDHSLQQQIDQLRRRIEILETKSQ